MQVFDNVQWVSWIALMVAYSGFYFCIDTLVVTRALNWFIKPIRYRDILPIRASAYIISIFNEQIGKGAMAYYLNRRDRVPGWEVGSVMLFVMFCEVFYLLIWATVGFLPSAQPVAATGVRDSFPIWPWGRRCSSPRGCCIFEARSVARQRPAGQAHRPRVPNGDPAGTMPCFWCCAHRRCWRRWSCTPSR